MASRIQPQTSDVVIAGGGPAGLTLALGLAAKGFDAAVVDAAPPKLAAGANAGDSRAFFIAYGCWRIFRALGLEDALLADAQAVTSVEAEGRLGGISFLAEECESEPVLGYMVEAGRLNAALLAAAKANPRIRLVAGRIAGATFGDPHAVAMVGETELRGSLLVGCDGGRSAIREAAGIRFEGWDYEAKAISATVKLGTPHHGAARQVFLPGGPLAVLPLTGDRANLVWTERADVAEALMALDDKGFEAELAKRSKGFLPGATLVGARHAFPLGLRLAERFHGSRVALAGDSAHLIHPLAGQGLNLGLKDVAALIDVIAEAAHAGLDIGTETALAPYTRWRRADVVATAAAMEGFARAFSAPLPVRLAAGLAMQAAGSSRTVRKLFAREAGGDLGELPSLMRAG